MIGDGEMELTRSYRIPMAEPFELFKRKSSLSRLRTLPERPSPYLQSSPLSPFLWSSLVGRLAKHKGDGGLAAGVDADRAEAVFVDAVADEVALDCFGALRRQPLVRFEVAPA